MHTTTKIIDLDDKYLPFTLENGQILSEVSVAYESYGEPDEEHANTILICHALTGDAHAAGSAQNTTEVLRRVPLLRAMKPDQAGWWDGMIGPGKTFNTDQFNVICTNILGSCYGTTGPVSLSPEKGEIYGSDFPIGKPVSIMSTKGPPVVEPVPGKPTHVLTKATPLFTNPDEEGPVTSGLAAGSLVTLLDMNAAGDWARIGYKKLKGYVPRSLLLQVH